MKASSILLIKPSDSSFIRVDYSILSSIAPTKSFALYQNKSRLAYLGRLLIMPLVILRQRRDSLVCIWFADYHAALAVKCCKLKGIKSVVFIGGYDAVCYPTLGMGVYCRKLRGMAASYALRNCKLIVANHSALIDGTNLYFDPQGHKDGIRNFVPKLNTPTRIVYNALTTSYSPDLDHTCSSTVISVGTTPRMEDFINKGFDLLIEAAKLRPSYEFVLIGVKEEWLRLLEEQYHFSSIENLQIHGYMPQEKILKLLETSKVYAQLSISEGMPNSLMEGMLCGCVPVGSDVAGIPTLIGKEGYIVKNRDINQVLDTLDTAMYSDIDPKRISTRIQDHFSYANRSNRLRTVIREL